MNTANISFSVHEYDRDGDIVERGIYLHFGDTRVKVSDDIENFKDVVLHIAAMVREIGEACPRV